MLTLILACGLLTFMLPIVALQIRDNRRLARMLAELNRINADFLARTDPNRIEEDDDA